MRWLVLQNNALHSEWPKYPGLEHLPKEGQCYLFNSESRAWYHVNRSHPLGGQALMPINLADVPKVYRLLILVLGHPS